MGSGGVGGAMLRTVSTVVGPPGLGVQGVKVPEAGRSLGRHRVEDAVLGCQHKSLRNAVLTGVRCIGLQTVVAVPAFTMEVTAKQVSS